MGGEDAPLFLLAESVVPGKENALPRQKGRRNQVKGVEGLAQASWRARQSDRGGGRISGKSRQKTQTPVLPGQQPHQMLNGFEITEKICYFICRTFIIVRMTRHSRER